MDDEGRTVPRQEQAETGDRRAKAGHDDTAGGRPLIAVTRAVSPRIDECAITHVERKPIDAQRAAQQHREYEIALAALDCTIVHAPPAPDLPDAVFVEDAALVLDEIAILTRPALPARQPEPASLRALLGRYRPLHNIVAPATLEGGDVLRMGRTLFAGRSARTNHAGIAQLRTIVEPLGYRVHTVAITNALHLKTVVSAVAHDTVLLNPHWVDPSVFDAYRQIEVDPAEPFAANALLVHERVLYAAEHVRTRQRLADVGVTVYAVPLSELAKAEAGVTCCSLLFAA